MKNKVIQGDCLEELKGYPDDFFDSVVTDPPYGLSKEPDIVEVLTKWVAGEPYDHGHGGFMGKKWDSFVPHPDVWKEVFRVLKPGGHALVFAGTRTQDLMTIAMRLGGFEIRDIIEWLYFSGFPKSMDVGKAFDKLAGAEREVKTEGPTVKRMIPGTEQGKTGSWIKDSERTFTHTVTTPATELAKQWDGWGTALKPAHEPIIVARKPLAGTVAATVEEYGTGALNIGKCRIPFADEKDRETATKKNQHATFNSNDGVRYDSRGIYSGDSRPPKNYSAESRFPANAVTLDEGEFYSPYFNISPADVSKKAMKRDRGEGNTHPTVKPTGLMEWLVRLVTPPGGTVLDPFAGSGTTLVAAKREGFDYVGVEMQPEYHEICLARTEGGAEQ